MSLIPPIASLQSQHATLLATGIEELYDFLQKTLGPPWEVYAHPFFNGDRPHIVALHPAHGLTFFAVMPWDLRQYRCEHRGRYLRYTLRTDNQIHPVLGPVRQAENYVENLLNFYMPYIGETVMRDRRALSAFQLALYFPLATTHAAQVFAPIAPGRGAIFGQDAIAGSHLATVLPMAQRPSSRPLPDDWLQELHFWLTPPIHNPAVVEPLTLTEVQRRHILPSPGQHQRLHGVAGSGKTLVIAQRAANLAAAGKRVLVITFNVALWQYIRRLLMQTTTSFPWQNIEFHHFHGFCKNFLTENNVEWPQWTRRPPEAVMDELVTQLVISTLQADKNANQRSYDAILIDEGQDFQRSYYDTLCHFLSDNDELLFVADRQQNLYRRDESWLEQMSGTKFRGRWREMKESYRLPYNVAQEATRFAELFLTNPTPVTPAANTDQADSYLAWHNITSLESASGEICRTVQWLIQQRRVAPADIVILTPDQRDGWLLVNKLEQQQMAVNHLLTEDDGQIGRKQRRFRKRTFALYDQRITVSTIHSFKGWEMKNVIVITPPDDRFWAAQGPYLFYVAMTRTRQNLIVFNRHPAYRAYGATWNEQYQTPPLPTRQLAKDDVNKSIVRQ